MPQCIAAYVFVRLIVCLLYISLWMATRIWILYLKTSYRKQLGLLCESCCLGSGQSAKTDFKFGLWSCQVALRLFAPQQCLVVELPPHYMVIPYKFPSYMYMFQGLSAVVGFHMAFRRSFSVGQHFHNFLLSIIFSSFSFPFISL